jgi:hypothetical protein
MFKRITIITALLVAAVCSVIWSQKIIDPQVLAQQEEQKKRADESGYGDIEIDNLHREIAMLAPRAAPRMKKKQMGVSASKSLRVNRSRPSQSDTCTMALLFCTRMAKARTQNFRKSDWCSNVTTLSVRPTSVKSARS